MKTRPFADRTQLARARELVASGKGRAYIRHQFVHEGVDPDRADWLAQRAVDLRRATHLGRLSLAFGVVGVGATLATLFGLSYALRDTPLAAIQPVMTMLAVAAVVAAMTFLIGHDRIVHRDDRLDWDAHPVIPPWLARTPRRVSDGRDRRRAAMISMLTIFTAGVPLLRAGRDIHQLTQLRRYGVETTAHAGLLMTSSDPSTHRSFYYTFDAGGPHGGSGSVPHDIAFGDSLPVTYLPSNPEINLPLAKSSIDTNLMFDRDAGAVVSGVIILATWPLFGVAGRDRKGRLLLARHGIAVVGQVLDVDGDIVRYRFRGRRGDVDGTAALGKEPDVLPRTGDGIVILYNPRDDSQNAPVVTMTDIELVER